MNKRILFLIQQAGMLMQMPRTHQRTLGNTFDTVASHSHHTSIIAYCIARMENLTFEEALKAMAMANLHDLQEARTGDIDYIGKNYTKRNEEKAIKDTYAGIEFGNELEDLLTEYEKRETLISKCVKDADIVEQMYQEWVLMWQGNKLAEKWFEGSQSSFLLKLHTNSAKDIALSMKTSNPHEWWWSEFVEKK